MDGTALGVERTVETVAYEVRPSDPDQAVCFEHFLHQGRDYTVSVKSDRADSQLRNPTGNFVAARTHGLKDSWLQSHGYPTISDAQKIPTTGRVAEYHAEPYYYFVTQTDITILSVTDAGHHPISPAADPVFAHLLRTFQQ